jgi:hypothetical protein
MTYLHSTTPLMLRHSRNKMLPRSTTPGNRPRTLGTLAPAEVPP